MLLAAVAVKVVMVGAEENPMFRPLALINSPVPAKPVLKVTVALLVNVPVPFTVNVAAEKLISPEL